MKVITTRTDHTPQYNIRSICPPEEMLLFDIETTGLKKETTQLYLIGCAWFDKDSWHIRQYLTENAGDEYYALDEFLKLAAGYRTLVHFNGDGFDIPYLQYKCNYYGFDEDLGRFESFDIYKRIRKARRLLKLTSMSQKAVEEYLGIEREDKLNGGLLIPVYYEYELTGSPEKEELLLLHNHDDLEGMLRILPVLAYRDLMDGHFYFEKAQVHDNEAIVSYCLQQKVPVAFRYQDDSFFSIEAKEDQMILSFKLESGTGRLPLPNISDYYYLPEEDRVVHKEVAQFLAPSRRRKATRKNCFVKKEGLFLRQVKERFLPVYYLGEDQKTLYGDWEDIFAGISRKEETSVRAMEEMAQDILDLVSCL